MTSWITRRPAAPVGNIRKRTISAAAYARARYPELAAALRQSSSVTRGSSGRITREVMSRAANDLADIIRTIPTGTGKAPTPAVTTMRFAPHPAAKPHRRGLSRAASMPRASRWRASAVYFVWPTPSGTRGCAGTPRQTEARTTTARSVRCPSTVVHCEARGLGKERALGLVHPNRPLVDGPPAGRSSCPRPDRSPYSTVRRSPSRATSPASRAGLRTDFTWTVGDASASS